MTLSSKYLLSALVRERCVAKLKKLPALRLHDQKPKYTASVLVPLCIRNEDLCLLYTLRSYNLKSHSGQVSFPGGKTDENETVVFTALRETAEEIGVAPEDVDIWGEMSQVQGRNKDMLIMPVVGFIKNFDMNKLNINTEEVEEVFTISIKDLCNPNNHGHIIFEKNIIPIYLNGKHIVWGITGLITHFFLQCLLPKDIYNFDFSGKRFKLDELMPSKL